LRSALSLIFSVLMVLCISALGQNTANGWFEEGRAFYNQNNYDDAILAFDKALELDPQYIDAWKGKGSAYLHQQEYYEAILAFDKALELDPQLTLVWSNKGLAHFALGQLMYEEALQAYDKALELDPEDAYAWQGKGTVLICMGRDEEAMQAYNKSLELFIGIKNQSLLVGDELEAARAWDSIGTTLSSLGKEDEAIKAYEEAIKLVRHNISFEIKTEKDRITAPLQSIRNLCYAALDPKDKLVHHNTSLECMRLEQQFDPSQFLSQN
jgi:tetratricopeptide (TPR) repeat protein